MKGLFHNRKVSIINVLVLILVGSFVITGGIFAPIFSIRNTQYAIQTAYETLGAISTLVEESISTLLDEKIKELKLIEDEMEPDTISYTLSFFDDGIIITNEKGIIKRAYPKNRELLVGRDVSFRDYFKKPKETLRPYLAGSFKSLINTNIVVLGVPIIKNGRFKGVIAGGMSLNGGRIGYLVSSVSFLEKGEIVIVDDRGIVLFSKDPTLIGRFFNRFPTETIGFREYQIEGKKYLGGIRDIENSSWRIVLYINKDIILKHQRENLRFSLFFSISLVILIIIIVILLLRKILATTSYLVQLAEEYSMGNYSKIPPPSRYREFSEFSEAFGKMRDAIVERESKLKEEYAYLDALLKQITNGIFILDTNGRFNFTNPQLAEMLGYLEKEVLQSDTLDLFPLKERAKIAVQINEALSGEIKSTRTEMLSKANSVIPVLLTSSPLKIDGNIVGTLNVVTDLQEISKKEKELQDALEEINVLNEELSERSQQLEMALARLNMRLFEVELEKDNAEKLAITDPLTHLYNRRFFEERFKDELLKTKISKTQLSLIMADIDHFKVINDTYGHKVGDKVLEVLALILKANVRDKDIVARYGGEEFMILLPNTNKIDAQKVAERIRQEIEETPLTEIDGPERFTVSFGVAGFPEDGEDINDLFLKVDQALYEAKKLGRNRVVVYRGN
ncbi:MAG: diguanylate cyclase [bacterium]